MSTKLHSISKDLGKIFIKVVIASFLISFLILTVTILMNPREAGEYLMGYLKSLGGITQLSVIYLTLYFFLVKVVEYFSLSNLNSGTKAILSNVKKLLLYAPAICLLFVFVTNFIRGTMTNIDTVNQISFFILVQIIVILYVFIYKYLSKIDGKIFGK